MIRSRTAPRLALAALSLALRFVPYSDHHGHFNLGWTLVLIGFGLLAVGASLYLVYVLEILKFKNRRTEELRSLDPDTSEHEIEQQVAHDIETGEFDRVK